MRRTGAMIAAALLLCAASGCGTIKNMNGQSVMDVGGAFPVPTGPFGGVAQDLQAAIGLPFGFILLADVPFSLVGDIVTLPWATYQWLQPRQVAPVITGASDSTKSKE